MTGRRSLPPALVLFFLAPMIGELLSGSAPPVEFFNPFSLLILAALYGSGAILARELTLRWGKGWPTLLTLGAAYGILEEGLMVKSFFDPNWIDLGPLGSYGRWAGVNWVWSLELTIYHAVFSITIPVLLVTLMLPGQCARPWVGRRTFRFLGILLAADVLFGYLALTPYRPPLAPYLLAALTAAGLVILARRLPAGRSSAGLIRRPVRPIRVGALAFAATVVFFALSWALPNTGTPPLVTLLLTAGLATSMAWMITRMASRPSGWSPQHALALAVGGLSFFVLLAPLQELDRTRPDNTAGMSLVGLAAIGLFLWLARRLRRPEAGGLAFEDRAR